MTGSAVLREADRSVLRWGGLAGIAGGLLFIAVFALVIIFVGPEPSGVEGPIRRFAEIRTARTVENGLYLAVMALWVPFSVALGARLRAAHPAPALFGGALNLLGLAVLAAGALPHVVGVRLSDQYHAPGATADDRAALAFAWQTMLGMFDALLLAGLFLMSAGMMLLGLAMHRDAAFGRAVARTSVALGITGFAASVVVLVDPLSPVAALGVCALIGFHVVVGWKVATLPA